MTDLARGRSPAPLDAPDPADPRLLLQFFDQLVALQGDSTSFLDVMAVMYRHFRVTEAAALGRAAWPVRYLLPPAGAGSRAILTLGEQALRLLPGEAGEGLAYEHTLYALMGRVRSHFLVHAGAVALRGQGLILAADAANGKTTLVLELLRRGFSFLSDELAALSRADGRLHAFPRALRLRADTLARVGLPLPPHARQWLGKLLVDIDDLAPGQRMDSADLAHVIFLSDGASQPAPEADSLCIRLERCDDLLLEQLRALPDVVALEVVGADDYPLLKIDAPRRMAALAQIERVCQASGIAVIDVIKRTETPASFAGPARLRPLPHSAAVIELLRRFQGGHHSALLEQDFGGQPTRLFQAVARLLSGVECHHLTVGALPEMADLVEGLVTA